MGYISNEQEIIAKLLQNKEFAIKIARRQHDAYYLLNGETPNVFLEEKENIAINLAGYYALESGLDYFVTTTNQSAIEVLQAIVSNKLSATDKDLFCRFANATWKAGQPFRSLDRITRPVFKPFSCLTENEIEKDWVQITVAAEVVLEEFQQESNF